MRLSLCRIIAGVVVIPLSVPGVSAAQEQRDLPDAADMVEAYTTAREWVTAFAVPEVEASQSAIRIGGASAVFVMLRSAGRVVGTGWDDAGDDRMLRRAVGQALSELTGDPALANMPYDERDDVGARVTLELEVAGAMSPVVASTFDELSRQMRPGLDGLALRAGERSVLRFPAHQRAMNSPYIITFVRGGLLPELEIAPADRDLRALRDEEGLTVHRFSTIHLAQSSATGLPFSTFRGGRVVSATDADRESLAACAAGIVQHLLTHNLQHRDAEGELIPDEPLGLLGSYDPAADRHGSPPPSNELFAPAYEQAMVSFALSYFARTPGAPPDAAGQAASFAEQILVELADVLDVEIDPNDDPAASAMIVLAVDSLIQNPTAAVREMESRARARVWQSFDAQARSFVQQMGAENRLESLRPETRAMLAATMARLLLRGEQVPGGPATVRAALDAVWLSVDGPETVGLLPWIGWAEMDYASAGLTAPQEVVEQFNVLRDLLWASQAGFAMARSEPDVVGGFLLAGPFGTHATAQGLRPGAWLARRGAFGSDLATGDVGAEMGKLLSFGRFILQIQVREEDAWVYRNRQRAVGGIRDAVWDSRQRLPAQALALLTISDILRGLDRLGG